MVTVDNHETGNFTVNRSRVYSIRESATVDAEKVESKVFESFPCDEDEHLKQKISALQKKNAITKQACTSYDQLSLKRVLCEVESELAKIERERPKKIHMGKDKKVNEGLFSDPRAHQAKSLITPEAHDTSPSHESSGGRLNRPSSLRHGGSDAGPHSHVTSMNLISSSISPPRKRSRVSSPQPFTPPPVKYHVSAGVPGVINSSEEYFSLEIGDENSAPSVGEIEGAREENGIWYLYTKKTSKVYLEFDFATLAAVDIQKIKRYALQYRVWGLLEQLRI
ncbi:hypothetical protein DICA4_A05182 [Diutina catenulata]